MKGKTEHLEANLINMSKPGTVVLGFVNFDNILIIEKLLRCNVLFTEQLQRQEHSVFASFHACSPEEQRGVEFPLCLLRTCYFL